GQLALQVFEKLPRNALASEVCCNDKLTEIGPEAQVVTAREAVDRGVFAPNERKTLSCADRVCERVVTPLRLPEPRHAFHQTADRDSVLTCGLPDHRAHLRMCPGLRSQPAPVPGVTTSTCGLTAGEHYRSTQACHRLRAVVTSPPAARCHPTPCRA